MRPPPSSVDVPPGCSGLRTFLVPPDIVAVARRSPPRVKKRTPWRPQPDGQSTTSRAGQRAWFSDGIFVESQEGHARSAYSASAVVHTGLGVALLLYLILRPDQLSAPRPSAALVMPVLVAPVPTTPTEETPKSPPTDRPQPRDQSVVQAAMLPPAPPPDADTLAPVEAPTGIAPETGAENRVGGVVGGIPGGVPGGVIGGVGTAPPAATGTAGSRVMRAGTDIKPPRKIKDVKPVYPANALPMRVQGSVLIEAIIGTDGKVHDTKVLLSVPVLDQAALDAVRLWEYEPSLLNGVAVAVIMTIIVKFALQ